MPDQRVFILPSMANPAPMPWYSSNAMLVLQRKMFEVWLRQPRPRAGKQGGGDAADNNAERKRLGLKDGCHE